MAAKMILVNLLGGLGLFLYGMNLTSDGLQRVAAGKMKSVLGRLTRSPFLGVVVGIIITFLLQSSSAATVLLVGFVSAGLLTLTNAMGVIMGSAIGTTLTVQLIAFKITDYALLLVAAGSLMFIFGEKKNQRFLGQVILGFGLIFYGMGVMSGAMEPLRNSAFFTKIVTQLTGHQIITVIISALFTGMIQSSAATLALTMSLVSHNVINFPAAIAIMLGANIGTTATALISSLASGREAKRVAVANFAFKLLGVLIFIPFLQPFSNLVLMTAGDVSRQIANGHTIFNVAITALMLPFSSKFANVLMRLMPDTRDEEIVTKFISKDSLGVPDIALWQTKNELVRMARIIKEEMLAGIMKMIADGDEGKAAILFREEDRIDKLYREISNFITSLVQGNLSEEQSEQQVKYLNISNDLEHLGDVIFEMSKLAGEIRMGSIKLKDEDWQELLDLHEKIINSFEQVIESIATEKEELAAEVLKKQPEIARIEKRLRYNHFMRITCDNNEEDIESSSKYLDLMNDLVRINQHVISIAQAAMGIV